MDVCSRLCLCVPKCRCLWQYVCVKLCMSTEPLHGEVIAHWPFCGGKVGEQ